MQVSTANEPMSIHFCDTVPRNRERAPHWRRGGSVMTSGSSSANRQAEDAIERIRALNEQILESGREWGQGFLDAYEQSIRTFADFQVRAAEGTDVEWLSQIARAQADFTREVTKYAAEAGRRMLK